MGNEIGKFYGIGVGPGDPELLTLKAVKSLQAADIIFDVVGPNSKASVSGGILDSYIFSQPRQLGSVLDSLRVSQPRPRSGSLNIYLDSLELTAERCPLTFSMAKDYETRHQAIVENAEIVAERLKAGLNCAFATIGDPMVYSTYIYLRKELLRLIPDLVIETVPGITSFQAVAAKAETPLVEDCENLCVIPAFSEENIHDFSIETADTVVFLKSYHTRNKIIEFLDAGNIQYSAIYAARIGLDEEVICQNIDEIKNLPDEYLSMLIIKIIH